MKNFISEKQVMSCRRAILDRSDNGYYLSLYTLYEDIQLWIDHHIELCQNIYKIRKFDENYWQDLSSKLEKAILCENNIERNSSS